MTDLLDNIPATTEPLKKLPKQGNILAGGIVAIPFSFGIIGLILSIVTIINATKAINIYKANPDSYFDSSLKKVKAGRVCAIVSLSLLVVGVITLSLLASNGML